MRSLISDSILKLLLIKFDNDEIAGIATNHNPSSIHKMIIKMSDFDEEIYYLGDGDADMIDMEATDGVLYGDGDSMFEIKNPEKDIRVRIKEK
jgi:hypothetical protein